MFQLSAFTDEISQDLEHACAVLQEFGGTGVEIRGVWNTGCEKLTDHQIAEIRRITQDRGMRVCSIGSPFGKCDLEDAQAVAGHMDVLRRCAEAARELACPMVRGFAFWDSEQAAEKPWDAMVRAYEPVPGILEEMGVFLGLENEAACYVGTAAHTRVFLDRMQCDRIKAVWDPANHVHDPQGQDVPPFPDGYGILRDDIIHVHVKDAGPDAAGEMQNRFMGTGLVRWVEQLQALKDDGYHGFISLETHVQRDALPDELAEKYAPYLTGDAKESASKVCLAWLRDAIDGLL